MHQAAHPEKTKHKKLAWLVVTTASLYFFYQFIQLNLFNTISVPLMKEFSLNAVQLGQLSSMYFYSNCLMLFPAGMLLDRFSTKRTILITLVITTLGNFLFTIADGFLLAAIGRLMVGVGAAFCFLSCIKIASHWFPPHRMALATGWVVVMAMLGGLVAQTPLAVFLQHVSSWRDAMYVDTAMGVVIFLLILFIVQDNPPDAKIEKHAHQHALNELGIWRSLRLAAVNPQNWLGGVYTALMNLPVFILGALWGVHYLQEVRGFTLVQASFATTLLFVGLMFGSPAFGWFSDHIERRVLPMVIGGVLSIVVILVLMYVPNLSLASVIALFFLTGFVSSAQVLSYPVIAELNPPYLSSTALSIDSFLIMASGFVFQPLFGWLMQLGGNNGVMINAADFNRAMLMLPVSFVVALVVTVFIKETNCRSQFTV